MCPEARESGQIRIYRCAEFPLKWELQTVIMENVRAADTMLFERRGKWWMLTNLDESGAEDHCSELYLFSSDRRLVQIGRRILRIRYGSMLMAAEMQV